MDDMNINLHTNIAITQKLFPYADAQQNFSKLKFLT